MRAHDISASLESHKNALLGASNSSSVGASGPSFWRGGDLLELSVLSDESRSPSDGAALEESRHSLDYANLSSEEIIGVKSSDQSIHPLTPLRKAKALDVSELKENKLGYLTARTPMPTRPVSPNDSQSQPKPVDSTTPLLKNSFAVNKKAFKTSKVLAPPDPARESLHARGVSNSQFTSTPISEEERAERLEVLAKPPSHKDTEMRTGPLFATEKLDLSLDGVSALQKRPIANYLKYCGISAKSKLRITANLIIGDNKDPSSADLMRASVPHLTGVSREFISITTTSNQEPRLAAEKLRRNDAQAAAVEAALFNRRRNSFKEQRVIPDYIMRYTGFMHRFSFGFVCIVFNFSMGILATLDLDSPKTIPGVTICPQNLVRGSESKRLHTAVNLVEINTSILPENVFAVLPVVFDDADRLDCDVTLAMDLLACSSANAESCSPTRVVGSINPINWRPLDPALEQFHATRVAEARTPRLTSEVKSTHSPVSFFAREAYAPIVLVRGAVPEKGWGVKALHAVLRGPKLPHIIESAVQVLIRAFCVPFSVMHIEHCCDCATHSLSTWHVPGSYEKLVNDLRRELRDRLPPMLIYTNEVKIKEPDARLTDGGFSRIGSFEVSFRPYYSGTTQQLFSKLSAKHLPAVEDVVSAVSSVIVPDKLYLKKPQQLRVRVYNSYSKRVVLECRVQLYKINILTSSDIPYETMVPYELFPKSIGGFDHLDSGKRDYCEDEVDDAASAHAMVGSQSVMASALKALGRPKNVTQGLKLTRSKESSTYRQILARTQRSERLKNAIESKTLPPRITSHIEKPKGLYKSIIFSDSVQDSAFRHSMPFYRVRTWGPDEVSKWFKSHGASDSVIEQAQMSGVYDGVSLLALTNKVTLRDWGIKSKSMLRKLDESLTLMNTEFSNAEYDPYMQATFDPTLVSFIDSQVARAVPAYSATKAGRDSDIGRSFELIDDIPMSAKGYLDFNIDQLGSYVIKVASPQTETFWSKVFSISSKTNINYGISVKPLLVPVFLQVCIDADAVEALDGVPHSHRGVLISVVNLEAGRRHISLADFNNIYCNYDYDKNGDQRAVNKRLSCVHIEQRQGSLVDLLSVNEVSKIHPLNRFGSRFDLAGHERRRNPRVVLNDNSLSTNSEDRFIISLLWLPEGTYYSEVDGSVFKIARSERFNGSSSAVEHSIEPEIVQSYSLKQAIKCHKRLIRLSVRGFQLVYRRYKKSYVALRLNAYFTLKRASRQIRERVRLRVTARRAIQVQSWVRMLAARLEYRRKWHAIVLIQAYIRGWLGKLRRQKMAFALWTLSSHIMMWIIRRRSRRLQAAIRIQCAYRCFNARRILNCLQFAKRFKPQLRRYVRGIRARIRESIFLNALRRIQARENQLMAAEDAHMKRHIVWLRLEERRKLLGKLAVIEKKKNRAASVIQARLRGVFTRGYLNAAQRAVVKLQTKFLLRRYLKSIIFDGNSLKNDHPWKKQYWRFNALQRHPELIGSAILLAGLPLDSSAPYNVYRLSRRTLQSDVSRCRTPRKANVEATRFDDNDNETSPNGSIASLSSKLPSENRQLEYPNELERYDPDYLLYCVCKIQSAARMYLSRRNYLALREEINKDRNTSSAVYTIAISDSGETCTGSATPDKLNLRVNEPGEENLTNYYPGYYLEDGRYIYFEKDEESGYERYGYYDGEGAYIACDGDFSKVRFPPETTKSKDFPPQQFLDPTDSVYKYQPETTFGNSHESTSNSPISSLNPRGIPQQRSQVSSPGPKLMTLLTGGLLGHKLPGTPSQKQGVNDPEEVLVDEIVSVQSDEESLKVSVDQDGLNRSSNSLMAGLMPRLNSKQLLRPWSFHSDAASESSANPGGADNIGTSIASNANTSPSKSGGLSSAVKEVLSASAKALSSTGSAMKSKAVLKASGITNAVGSVTKQLKSNAERNKAEKERSLRIRNFKFEATDALLMLSGTNVEDAVRLNRAWFIAILPQTTDVFSDSRSDRLAQVASRSRSNQEYEIAHGRQVGESARSKEFFPLSKDVFCSFSMYAHLADLSRYASVDVCLFVEADDDPLLRSENIPTDDPSLTQLMARRNAERTIKLWVPAFRGEIELNEGASFGPCGGRANVLLKPIMNDMITLTASQARHISNMDGLLLSVALLPVAVPSMSLLRSLVAPTVPVVIPDHIIDAVLLQKYKSDSVVQEPSLCAAYFKDRMLVSARAKGKPIGLLEYNSSGEYIGRVTSHIEKLGTVSHLVAGFRHVIACSTDGMMGVFTFQRGSDVWDSPRILRVHDQQIVNSAVVHRSGIDFFFTIDKGSNIGVTILEEGRILKHGINPQFTNSGLSSIAAFANMLYIGQVDGGLCALDVKSLIVGGFERCKNLESMVIFSCIVMPNKTPITSLAVVATNSHAYLSTEDPSLGRDSTAAVFAPSNKSSIKKKVFDSSSILEAAFHGVDRDMGVDMDDELASRGSSREGHVVVVGGGDRDPRVRVLRLRKMTPEDTEGTKFIDRAKRAADKYSFYEVAILRGHTRAVHSIVVDAAGRFIITASRDDKTLLVWNALTYTCEKIHTDVEFGSAYGGDNCLFLCSFKPPFLTALTVPREYTTKSRSGSSVRDIVADTSPDDTVDVSMVRSPEWCAARVRGDSNGPSKSIIRATEDLGEPGRSIVALWRHYHAHDWTLQSTVHNGFSTIDHGRVRPATRTDAINNIYKWLGGSETSLSYSSDEENLQNNKVNVRDPSVDDNLSANDLVADGDSFYGEDVNRPKPEVKSGENSGSKIADSTKYPKINGNQRRKAHFSDDEDEE